MTKYDGVLVRDGNDDVGEIPYKGEEMGMPCHSPDILPLQSITSVATLISAYDKGYSGDDSVQIGQATTIYVRGKNVGTSDHSASAKLYYTLCSLMLHPKNWVKVFTGVNGEYSEDKGVDLVEMVNLNGNTTLSKEQVAVTRTPFFLLLPTPTDSSLHYCLISEIVTKGKEVTIPKDFATAGEYIKFIIDHPGFAYRNLITVSSSVSQMSQTVHYGNPSKKEIYATFSIKCTNGIPKNSTVKLTPRTLLLKDEDKQKIPYKIKSKILDDDHEVNFSWKVPASYDGMLLIEIIPPIGGSFDKGAKVNVTKSMPVLAVESGYTGNALRVLQERENQGYVLERTVGAVTFKFT
ncbi:MAG: hypothetical protein HQL76_15110 [Magnetococcales bacterium]|nr:hypothetical protein [Magnetococcales bacterium]